MKRRQICSGVEWLGGIDWNRRLFEALTPTPDGTSYNAYLVRGSERTALLDAADPVFESVLMSQLDATDHLDYVVCHHVEQDHSGAISAVLKKYDEAVVLCSPRAKPMLVDHINIAPERIKTVEDNETLSLGGKTLRFVHAPWVHWPETMLTHLEEDRILFSCDLFGAHIATTDLYASGEPYVMETAKRYYAEIMMPYRKQIQKYLKRISALEISAIAPSHGPIWDQPQDILNAYADWVSDRISNTVVLPYISMHGSTEVMVNYLVAALAQRGIKVQLFELSTIDVGKFAMALVDAQTMVIGTPTFIVGPHPSVVPVIYLASLLHPKLKHAAVIGSYGWGSKAAEQITQMLASLKPEMLGPVLCKGLPRDVTFSALDALADTIRDKHALATAS